jgi:hypothetical protein
MNTTIQQKLIVSIKDAQRALLKLTPMQKYRLEKGWDIEHAYYSSAIEGSKLDKQEFERLAETVA